MVVANRLGGQGAVPDLGRGEDQVDLLEGLAGGLGAQEVDEGDGGRARQQHPQPDLPAHVLQRDPAREHRDEAEQPFAERAGRAAQVAELERCDLSRGRGRVSWVWVCWGGGGREIKYKRERDSS